MKKRHEKKRPLVRGATPDRKKLDKQIRKNYDAFSRMTFERELEGKYALLRDKKLVEVLDTVADAYKLGNEKFPDRMFSIQEIGARPVDLGFMSHVLCLN